VADSPDTIAARLESDILLETLAAAEHERWSHWQRYLHAQCTRAEDGSLTIPAELAARWGAQMTTPYHELSEQEKDSDREQVGRYLPAIVAALRGRTNS
jgi:hypothetical protein